MLLNGKIIRIPPRGPITRIFEQLMLYQSADLARTNHVARDIIRREALNAIDADINALREETEPFHTPPALHEKETRQR